MTGSPIYVARDLANLVDAASSFLAEALRRAQDARGRASFLVSATTLTGPVLTRLAERGNRAEFDWRRVDLFLTDERRVEPLDRASTFRALRQNLLSKLVDDEPTVHRIRGEAPDADDAARAYAAVLPERPDVLVLGMEPDGRIAGLAPLGALARVTERDCAVDGDSIGVTPALLARVRETCVLARGSESARSVVAATGGVDARRVPAALFRGAQWFCDIGAAAGFVPDGTPGAG